MRTSRSHRRSSLLRVTDVERQPFRWMGFVSVIIVSVLFALGLPLVPLISSSLAPGEACC
jgi:hypothetical protein